MKKDFDTWNFKKKDIDENRKTKFYHPRDIWWCNLGLNIGYEQDGKDTDFERPVLVLKSFGKNICLVVPLTTSEKKHVYRVSIGVIGGKHATVILSQIRVVDTKRFVEKIGVLNKEIFIEIQKHLRNFF